MNLFEKVRKFESMHIVFWLIKDSCWMLQFKILGAAMIIPTVFLAMYLVYKTRGTRDFFLNMAIMFWISANSYWMFMEFFNNDEFKYFASIPFALGFIFIIVFYSPAGKKRAFITDHKD